MATPTPGHADPPIERMSRWGVRQLAALQSTYPGWEIEHIIGGPEADRWTAELRRELTDRMRAAGVKEHMEAPDAFMLASKLSTQATLMHNARVYSWPD